MSKHSEHSSYREKLIEHLFVGELLKLSWLDHNCELEIANPEVDNSGYDIIAECYGVLRHIQLKAAHLSSSTTQQKVHIKLADKPSGCMVWIIFDEDTLNFDHFLFYGDKAGEPMPSIDSLKVAKHTKGNKDGLKAERPNIRVINKGQFVRLNTINELFDVLFNYEFDSKSSNDNTQASSVKVDDHSFKKLHRIENWANKPWQKNSQLISAFIELESQGKTIDLELLIQYCLENFGGAAREWKNNFNSMKSDHGNSHGKVFLQSDSSIEIYDEARAEIRKYFR